MFSSLHVLIHFPVFWFGVLCWRMNISGIHIDVYFCLLSSLNVEFYRDCIDQSGQIKPNERLVENPSSRQSIDLRTRMGVLRPLRIFRKLVKIKNAHSSKA